MCFGMTWLLVCGLRVGLVFAVGLFGDLSVGLRFGVLPFDIPMSTCVSMKNPGFDGTYSLYGDLFFGE